MPELPEVETVVRDLRPLLEGRSIHGVHCGRHKLRHPWKKTWTASLRGRRIAALRRRGKWILLDMKPEGLLILHLGMTGQLGVFPSEAERASHTHLCFRLDEGGEELRFRDIRRFGSATWHLQSAAGESWIDARLGPEPFDLDAADWARTLQASSRCLKAILLDQTAVAGVGNIYADESLFEARLDPRQRGVQTSAGEAERLRGAMTTVLHRAIGQRGSSIRNYVGGSGLKGEYQNAFRVYGRTGQPCPACQEPIAALRLAGRSTHYCPNCQSSRLTSRNRKRTRSQRKRG